MTQLDMIRLSSRVKSELLDVDQSFNFVQGKPNVFSKVAKRFPTHEKSVCVRFL